MGKQNMVYNIIEYYSAFKRKEILIYITIWMNLEDTVLGIITQSHT